MFKLKRYLKFKRIYKIYTYILGLQISREVVRTGSTHSHAPLSPPVRSQFPVPTPEEMELFDCRERPKQTRICPDLRRDIIVLSLHTKPHAQDSFMGFAQTV